MQYYSTHILEPLLSVWRHRSLVWQMSRKDVIGRYRGSVLGLVWSIFNPIFMLIVYTFVFSVVFKGRWGVVGYESEVHYAIILFVGLVIYNLFTECFNRAPTLVLSNANYVKKVVFPLDILPWITMFSALFHTFVSVVVLFAGIIALGYSIPWTAIMLPLIIFPLILFTMGIGWFLAATGVYIRDISQTTGIISTALLFLSPVFYPVSVLPDAYQKFIQMNPLTFVIEEARQILIWGHVINWAGWAMYCSISVLVAWLGFVWFQKTRKGFADVV